MQVLGVDLAGSEKRATGVAYKEGGKVKCAILYQDSEIIQLAHSFTHVFIDAPLSLPIGGRKNLNEKNGIHLRECDYLLRKMGIRLFPPTLGHMRMLTHRGIKLKIFLEGLGKEVYEVFPGAFYDVMGVGRKDRKAILMLYRNMGLKLQKRTYTQDELDGVACLLLGYMFLEGKGVLLKGIDGGIVVPKRLLEDSGNPNCNYQ